MEESEPDFSLPPIEDVLEEILRDKKPREFYYKKYPSFQKRYPTLSNKVFEENLDVSVIKYMISQMRKMNQNEISEKDASNKVGSLLVDKFVKPNLPDH